MNNTVLVTGGAGYIGSHTVLTLLKNGYDVVICDNFANSQPKTLENLQKLSQKSLVLAKGDIHDQKFLDELFVKYNPSSVIHFAGLKAVVESQDIPLDYYSVNVSGSLSLLHAMEKHGCHRLVFSSTAAVYGEAQYLPYDESHPLCPTHTYGRTKYFIEEIIKDWAAANAKVSAIILRYVNPVGADVSGLIGESPNNMPSNIMPLILKVAAAEMEKLDIFGNDYDTRDGTCERDFIHVEDLASAHLTALEYSKEFIGHDVFNIGTGKGTTVLEVIKAFEKINDKTIPYEIGSRRKGDIPRSVADITKAQRILNWSAKLGLTEICQSAWQWKLNDLSDNQSESTEKKANSINRLQSLPIKAA